MSRRINVWLERFWSVEVDARFLGVVRISFCLLAIAHLWQSFPQAMEFYYGSKGLMDTSLPGFSLFSWSPLQFLPPGSLGSFRQLTICALAIAAFGIFTRPLLILALLWHLTAFRLTQPMAWHVDQLFMLTNFYLLFLPLDTRLSIKSWKNRGFPVRFRKDSAPKPVMEQAYALRLIQIQLCLIYWVAGISKVLNPQWQDGTAVATFLSSWLTWGPLQISPVQSLLTSYWVIFVELMIPLALWHRKSQYAAFISGILLHGGILVTTQITVFSFLMILCHFSYFHRQIMTQSYYIHAYFTAKTPPTFDEIFRRRHRSYR